MLKTIQNKHSNRQKKNIKQVKMKKHKKGGFEEIYLQANIRTEPAMLQTLHPNCRGKKNLAWNLPHFMEYLRSIFCMHFEATLDSNE